jgi:eukaryotic-like serine/threonine-protein kinase
VSSSATSSNRFPEIPKYELQEEIGHGGMATVYRARDQRLDREVAIKVIHKHLRENPEVRSRFVSEARAVAKLRHPGIVEVYDVSNEDDEERYLIVELIRGQSLRQVLQQRKVLPPEVAATIVAMLCECVEHAHQHGVIHRDIKPENVLIELPRPRSSQVGMTPRPSASDDDASAPKRRPSDRPSSGSSSTTRVIVKLTDFGIAKVLDVQGVTSTGQILGSPAHMAPEQIEGGTIAAYTDVFALGVLLYECMVGHLPFEGKNPAQVLRRVLEGSYEPADAERPEVGGRWARVLARALHVDPEKRVQTAAELGTLIAQELAALAIDDAQGDLVEFFASPERYEERTASILVQRLLERGERERREGRVLAAAADFNRALAYRPEDQAILRRVSALSAERLWRKRVIRVGGIVAVSAGLFGVAYGATRIFKSDDPRPETSQPTALVQPPTSTDADTAVPPDTVGPVDTATAQPPTSSAAHTSEPPPTGQPTASTAKTVTPVDSATPSAGKRLVRFKLTPSDGMLTVDGITIGGDEAQGWYDPGPHKFVVSPSGALANDPCCSEAGGGFDVTAPPADKPEDPMLVPVRMKLAPATITLTATNDNSALCKGAVLPLGQPASVAVNFSENISCTCLPSKATRSLPLRSGRAANLQCE